MAAQEAFVPCFAAMQPIINRWCKPGARARASQQSFGPVTSPQRGPATPPQPLSSGADRLMDPPIKGLQREVCAVGNRHDPANLRLAHPAVWGSMRRPAPPPRGARGRWGPGGSLAALVGSSPRRDFGAPPNSPRLAETNSSDSSVPAHSPAHPPLPLMLLP